MTKHLYFFRHGETYANLEQKLMGGGMDSPLTAKGMLQAENLAKAIQTIHLDVLFISSNTRAQETANILHSSGNIPMIVTEEIKEQGFGIMTGVLLSEIPAHVDTAYQQDPYHFHHQGGESLDDVKTRVGKFLQKIITQDSYQHIGLVTHENVIRAAIAFMKDIDREVTALKIPHCSETHYFFSNDHKYHAIRVAHCY